jgi:general secretion pathway protein G
MRSGKTERAFTLLELITVVALISILAAIALPQYKVAIIQAKEATLRENLFRFRDLIDQYQADKGQYPASLETLVQEGYLRKIPQDPFTQAPDWVPVLEETDPDRPAAEAPGVFDVKSASEQVSMGGTPYAEW